MMKQLQCLVALRFLAGDARTDAGAVQATDKRAGAWATVFLGQEAFPSHVQRRPKDYNVFFE